MNFKDKVVKLHEYLTKNFTEEDEGIFLIISNKDNESKIINNLSFDEVMSALERFKFGMMYGMAASEKSEENNIRIGDKKIN